MCGVACYLGRNPAEGQKFADRSQPLLRHRGPDDFGVFSNGIVSLLHMRLSILELSELGHQPMWSACGRYSIIFNGEIYNHLELRSRFLPNHSFRGHSDTETVIELFKVKQDKMLQDLVGMWAMIIWDKKEEKIFISRDRYGQKPLYTRYKDNAWMLSSEIRPLLADGEHPRYDPTAVVEYLALGNYGHIDTNTFFGDIAHFPQGHFAWLGVGDKELKPVRYWVLPDVNQKDKVPFSESVKTKLHDLIVEAVLSQTLADVPIGITLSGGIDSSIITGILSKYYDKDIHVFTAQSPQSKFDETKYVDAVINMCNNPRLIVHRQNLNTLSPKEDMLKYIKIQEEPFGDPSIIAHGFLMKMAADNGIKVVLNGQGADELFFGYNNMAQAIVMNQFQTGRFKEGLDNIKKMSLGKNFFLRTILRSVAPGMEFKMRASSRTGKRDNIEPQMMNGVDDQIIKTYSYERIYNVWAESIYGVHIPHLVHYDDRNGMANSLEGRMPFLDHRIAELVATIRPDEFLKKGLRKYILREACKQYMPKVVYSRTDKIGFYTPLVDALVRDKEWVLKNYAQIKFINKGSQDSLISALKNNTVDTPKALHIWRQLSVQLWMNEFNMA